MDGGIGVADGIAANVAATAWRICVFGSGVIAFGEQAAVRNRIRLKASTEPRRSFKARGVCFFIQGIIQEKPRPFLNGAFVLLLVSASFGWSAVDDLRIGFTFNDEVSGETAL